MPYEGEYASYQPLKRIVESDKVKGLLKEARKLDRGELQAAAVVCDAPVFGGKLPAAVIAIDGSIAEVDVSNGYPGAKVGYCSVASVIVDLAEMEKLDEHRPVDPTLFRKTEEVSSDGVAMPGCNVVIRDHKSAKESFRDSVYQLLSKSVIDEEDGTTLLDTYLALLKHKPTNEITCPYKDCGCEKESIVVSDSISSCPCNEKRVIYPTDALRIHERFNEATGSNQEAYSYVMQVWERLILIHLLRCIQKKGWLSKLADVAFIMDGPLAVFGPPAWLSAAITKELRLINDEYAKINGHDILIIGIEKTGDFITHFCELDKKHDGSALFKPRQYFMPTDAYIKRNIVFSDSKKAYGKDTYFGRKLMYKTRTGALIVPCIATFNAEQDNLYHSDISKYPAMDKALALIDKLVTSRYPNALSPIVSAHSNAAIPLHLGQKVLKQLSTTLMRKN